MTEDTSREALDGAADDGTGSGVQASVRLRRGQILAAVRTAGFVTIQDLAERFAVTPQTVRRDINALNRDGLLRRYHGGAGVALSTENVDYPSRKVLFHTAKRRIAETVARHIPPRTSLFINIGTTTEAVAKELCGHFGLRIITNNLHVASILSRNENAEIIVAGGLVRHSDGGIVGEVASDFIRQFKVDIGIIGISGIDMDGTLLDFDYREVRTARAIMKNSRKVFMVTDHSKFGRGAMVRLGHVSEIDALFTDCRPPEELVEELLKEGVDLHVAGD